MLSYLKVKNSTEYDYGSVEFLIQIFLSSRITREVASILTLMNHG